jgi:PKD domain
MIVNTTNIRPRRFALLALAAALVVLGASAAGASADSSAPWGPLRTPIALEAGTGPGQVSPVEEGRTSFVVDPTDGAFYVADRVQEGGEGEATEFRLQRFSAEGKQEGEVQFSPPELKKSATHTLAEEVEIAVDPARDRVYALVVYRRKEGRVLDSNTLVAGQLYAFSTKEAGKLVSVKSGKEGPAPILGESEFKDQGETPKEALLDPRGMAVEPKDGDLFITGEIDEEESAKVVQEKAEKECHGAAQEVAITETGSEVNAQLGSRYVDAAGLLFRAECGFEEVVEPQYGPSSPAFSAGGKLFAWEVPGRPLCTEEQEEHGECTRPEPTGEIWELALTSEKVGETDGIQEFAAKPRLAYALPSGEQLLKFPEPQAGEFFTMGTSMSLVAEGASEGRIYLNGKIDSTEGFNEGVVVVHYSESGSTATLDQLGWTGGEPEAGGEQAGCVVPKPEGEGVPIGGFKDLANGKEGVLGFDAFEVKENGVETTRIELPQFGPGGKAQECPHATLSRPTVKVGPEQREVTRVLLGETATLSSNVEAADAATVTWKLENETTHEAAETLPGEALLQTTKLKHAFVHEGEYKVTEIVETDNLASPKVEVSRPLAVGPPHPVVKFTSSPTSVEVGHSAKFEATVEDQNASPTPFKYVLTFGDGAEESASTGSTTIIANHSYGKACSPCTVTLAVTDAGGFKGTASVKVEVHETTSSTSTSSSSSSTSSGGGGGGGGEGQSGGGGVQSYQALHDPEAKLTSNAVSVASGGALTAKVSCPAGEESCSGTITLRTLGAVSAGAHKRKAVLTLASAPFTVLGGQARIVTLHLSAKARALLSAAHGDLRVRVVIAAHDPAGVSKTTQAVLTLRLAKPKSHRHKH